VGRRVFGVGDVPRSPRRRPSASPGAAGAAVIAPSAVSRCPFATGCSKADDVDIAGSDGEGIASFGVTIAAPKVRRSWPICASRALAEVRGLTVASWHVDQPGRPNRLPRLQRRQGALLGTADRRRHATIWRFALAGKPDLHDLHRAALAGQPHRASRYAGNRPRLSAMTVPPQASDAGLPPRASTSRKDQAAALGPADGLDQQSIRAYLAELRASEAHVSASVTARVVWLPSLGPGLQDRVSHHRPRPGRSSCPDLGKAGLVTPGG
jgi:hypothetical protein